MEYKILVSANNSNGAYFSFYQESASSGDWTSTDKTETIAKIEELLNTYGLSEIQAVISLNIDTTIDIPDLPVTE